MYYIVLHNIDDRLEFTLSTNNLKLFSSSAIDKN